MKVIKISITICLASFILFISCDKESDSITQENLPQGFTVINNFSLFNSGIIFDDGEVVLAGRPKDSRTLGLLKLDEDCNEIWVRNYIETNYSEVEIIQQVDDRMVILGHLTNRESNIASINKDGKVEWVRNFDSDIFQEGMTIMQTRDNGLLVVGSIQAETGYHILLIKYNENGEELWRKTIEEEYSLGGFYSVEIENGNIIILAKKLIPPKSSLALLKINSEGEKIWIRETDIEVSFPDPNLKTILSNNSELITIINSPRKGNSVFDVNEMKIVKMDTESNIKWLKTINMGTVNSSSSILELRNKDLVILGSVSENERRGPVLLKLTTDGEEIWRKTYTIEQNFSTRDLIEINGGFMIIGFSSPFDDASNISAMILKVDSEGDSL